MNTYFNDFVSEYGGAQKVADMLGVSVHLIRSVKSGRRNVSSKLALDIDKLTNGEFNKVILLWGDDA